MDNWLALYIAIVYHREITPEQAFGVLKTDIYKKSRRKETVTREEILRLKIKITSKNFRDWSELERRNHIDRYTIMELVEGLDDS